MQNTTVSVKQSIKQFFSFLRGDVWLLKATINKDVKLKLEALIEKSGAKDMATFLRQSFATYELLVDAELRGDEIILRSTTAAGVKETRVKVLE